MISLKKYLDEAGNNGGGKVSKRDANELLPVALAAYRSALAEVGSATVDAFPALGRELQAGLNRLGESVEAAPTAPRLAEAERDVQERLQNWGRRAAKHSQERTGEIKEILISMARTAESVGERDQRCAMQISEVTAQLQRIASLEDLTMIRSSLKRSAAALKTSIDKMAAEGKAAVEKARTEITGYQVKLEKAEEIASKDALTGLRSRMWTESQIEERITKRLPLCVAILDLDDFKKVNDVYGHLAGDDVLKQFSMELKLACRSSDVIGRWGGDEFIILLDCDLHEAQAQTLRLQQWTCGDYTVQTQTGPLKLKVMASIGLAEHQPDETMKQLLARADADMYSKKSETRGGKR